MKGYRRLLWLFLLLVVLCGCKATPSQEVLKAPSLPEQTRLPVDYVFLLDNSGSIPQGEPRRFAKEAIKAFIELSETGDRIAIITFDSNAHLIVQREITTQESREDVKRALDSHLTFRGTHTDISQGMALLRGQTHNLFRGIDRARPVVILISDGKLEPRGDLQSAYQNLMEDWQSLSRQVSFYTIGLGETAIYDRFLPGVRGYDLLQRMASESSGKFYHVRSVEGLVEACLGLIRETKDYSEFAGHKVFWTDESTRCLAFLVIKRLPGRQLCQTEDIRVRTPSGNQVSSSQVPSYNMGNCRIRWQEGLYYDIIRIDRPTAGEWRVGLRGRGTPRSIALVRNQVHLRYLVKREYWDQEKKVVMAWLYDERTHAFSERPCKITVKFDSQQAFPFTENKISLRKTKEGAYIGLLRLNDKQPPIGNYLLEIEAEDDPTFFFRKSPQQEVAIKEAYFSFHLPQGLLPKWPLFWKGLKFRTEIDLSGRYYPGFREFPEATLHLVRLKEGRQEELPDIILKQNKIGNKLVYQAQRADIARGRYSAYIMIDGRLASGRRFRVESPNSCFTLSWPWWVWTIFVAIAATVILFLLFLFRPKLYGKLVFNRPAGRADIVLKGHSGIKMSLRGDSLEFGKDGKDLTGLKQTVFIIRGTRKRGLKVVKEKGNIQIRREGMVKSVSSGDLYKGDIIFFTDGGEQYELYLISPRRLMRKR